VRSWENLRTLVSVDNLDRVLQKQGRFEEAEVKYRRVLEGGEKMLGLENRCTDER